MYYSEYSYLNGNKKDLNKIYEIRNTISNLTKYENEKYEEAIYEYNKYIEIISNFLFSLDLKNSLEYSYCIGYMINSSFFSHNDKFESSIKLKNEIHTKPGVSIIIGEGCCRNMCDFHKDIMDKLNLYCKKFYCNEGTVSIDFLRKIVNATHVVNLINYENTLYGFDILNGNMLYYFVNDSKLKSLSLFTNSYLTYKPYFELLFANCDNIDDINKIKQLYKNESEKSHLNAYDYDYIKYDLNYKLKYMNDIFVDFSNETKDIKNNIYNLILSKQIDKE